MVEVKSARALKLLEVPVSLKNEMQTGMKRFPFDDVKVWASLEWDQNNVKNLSFYGELNNGERIIVEALGLLMKKKAITYLDQISLRECEAFLRDRNSEPAVTGMTEAEENFFKRLVRWLRSWSRIEGGANYKFTNEKGAFRQLKLVDKIREMKAYLASAQILTLYENLIAPELVDLEDLTVYIQAPYATDSEKKAFQELHTLGVEAFQEENLNFIPEP
jgi:hypothetical protein